MKPIIEPGFYRVKPVGVPGVGEPFTIRAYEWMPGCRSTLCYGIIPNGRKRQKYMMWAWEAKELNWFEWLKEVEVTHGEA